MLSAAKDLARGAQRCFAALSMTARTAVRAAHRRSLLSKHLLEKFPNGQPRLTLVYSSIMGFVEPVESTTRAYNVAHIQRPRNRQEQVRWEYGYIHNGTMYEALQL